MIFKKKKKKLYEIGDFITDDKNDFSIAYYYEKRWEELLKDNFDKTTKITDLKKEIEYLKNELYKYEEQNSKLQRKLVELRINNGENVITGEYIR